MECKWCSLELSPLANALNTENLYLREHGLLVILYNMPLVSYQIICSQLCMKLTFALVSYTIVT